MTHHPEDPARLSAAFLTGSDHARRAAEEAHQAELQKFQELVEQNPADAKAYRKLAECHVGADEYAQALAVLKKGIRQCPPDERLYRDYIGALLRCNRMEEALAMAEEALKILSEAGAVLIEKHLALPMLYRNEREIDDYRRRFEAGLEAWSREVRLESPAERRSALEAVRTWANFYLPYQGRNDRALQERYGEMLHRVMAANYPQWADPIEMPPAAGGRLRLGYVSTHFYHHSVMKTHLGWLLEHDRSRFEVYTYSVGNRTDSTTDEVRRASHEFRQVEELEQACAAIVKDHLHILVFLDIGMSPVMGLLGALRLAPVQCVTWGHPVTTGLPTIDYFLSNSLMEPEDAAEHYSERLVRLPGIGVCYRKPMIPRPILLKGRPDFDIRPGAVAYLSSQSLWKYLPGQDRIFAEIAQRVPNSQFVFVGSNELLTAVFRERLKRAFSSMGLDAGQFCVIVPRMSQLDYWNLSLRSDIYLDTMHFSGCITTCEAIGCDLPVVTMPGRLMRGRQSYGILQQMGVTETIAGDEKEYVEVAVRLGSDEEWRKEVAGRMRGGSGRLFGDRSCVRELEAFYERVAAKAVSES